MKHEGLIRLDDVLDPVEKHDCREELQGRLVPARIEAVRKARRGRAGGAESYFNYVGHVVHSFQERGDCGAPICNRDRSLSRRGQLVYLIIRFGPIWRMRVTISAFRSMVTPRMGLSSNSGIMKEQAGSKSVSTG